MHHVQRYIELGLRFGEVRASRGPEEQGRMLVEVTLYPPASAGLKNSPGGLSEMEHLNHGVLSSEKWYSVGLL